MSAALIDLLQHGQALKMLPRTGWLLAGVQTPESIADHTTGVALLVLFMAESINADWGSEGLTAPLRVERAATLALLHDLGESVLTDLPKRSAALLGDPTKQAAEEAAMAALMAELPGGNGYSALWQEYATAGTPEARLVKDADKLEMVYQALCYERAGQRNLDEFWQGHSWYYRASEALFMALWVERHV